MRKMFENLDFGPEIRLNAMGCLWDGEEYARKQSSPIKIKPQVKLRGHGTWDMLMGHGTC